MSIQDELNQIKNAVYGKDVRDAIHDSIKKTYDDASENGNANMEVKIARGTHPNLNTRLNKMEETDRQTTAQLAQNTTKQPVYAADFGVSHLNTAQENTVGLKNAVSKAETTSNTLILPWCPLGTKIEINDTIVINSDNFVLQGFKRNTHIHMAVLDKTIFETNGVNTYVGEFDLSGTEHEDEFVNTGLGTVGVQINGNFTTTNDIQGDVLTSLIRARNTSELVLESPTVTNIKSGHKVNFLLIAGNTRNLRYDNLTGSYSLTKGRGEPPHLIYVDHTDGYNYNIQGGYCRAENGTGSYAYQFKGCVGGNAGELYAKNCEGSYHVMDAEDFEVNYIESIDDTWEGEVSGSITLQVTPGSNYTNKRLKIKRALITMSEGRGFSALNTDDSAFRDITIETNHKRAGNNDSDFVLSHSNGNLIKNPIIRNIGSLPRLSSLNIKNSHSNTVDNPETSGNGTSVWVLDNNTGTNKIVNFNEVKNGHTARIQASTVISKGADLDVREGLSLVGKSSVLSNYEGTNYGYLDTGQRFEVLAGVIRPRITGGYLEPDSGVESGSVGAFEAGTPNVRFKGVVKYRVSATVMLRLMDVRNYLQVQLMNGNVVLRQRVDGVFSTITQQPYPISEGRYYDLDVSVYDETVTVKINGTEILSETVTTFSDETKFGVGGIGQLSCQWSDLVWSKA